MADGNQFKRGDKLSADWANNVSRVVGARSVPFGLTDKDTTSQRQKPIQTETIKFKNNFSTTIPKGGVFELDFNAVNYSLVQTFAVNTPVMYKALAQIICVNAFAAVAAGGYGQAVIIPFDKPTRVKCASGDLPKAMEMCGVEALSTSTPSMLCCRGASGLICMDTPVSEGGDYYCNVISGHLWEYEGQLTSTLTSPTSQANAWTYNNSTSATAIFYQADNTQAIPPYNYIADPAARSFRVYNRESSQVCSGAIGTYCRWKWINREWRFTWLGN